MKSIAKKAKKEYNSADSFLLGAFIFMLLTVIGLLIALVFVKANYTKKANVIVPITEKNKTASININVSNKKKGNIVKYKVKVRNYSGKDVNKKNMDYQIYIDSNIKATYTVLNDKGKVKLKNNLSKKFTLKNKTLQEDFYEIRIKLHQNTKKNKYINLVIGGV